MIDGMEDHGQGLVEFLREVLADGTLADGTLAEGHGAIGGFGGADDRDVRDLAAGRVADPGAQ